MVNRDGFYVYSHWHFEWMERSAQVHTVVLQIVGGLAGGSISGKIFHPSDSGIIWNAIAGAFGGVAGGQLIGVVLGKTAIAENLDIAGIIGPFVDGAVSGGLVQIVAGMILQRVLTKQLVRQGRRPLNY